jgi:hypothetical protein
MTTQEFPFKKEILGAFPHNREGRYLVSRAAIEAAGAPFMVAIHDLENLSESCNTDAIEAGDRAHFDDLDRGIEAGFHRCGHCNAAPAEASA